MRIFVRYLALALMIHFLSGCSSTREASFRARAGVMLLKPEEYARNKPYKPSKRKFKTKKKAQKSLLKRSYKIK